MKQFFDKQDLEKLKNNLKLKNNESNIEKELYNRSYKYLKYIKFLPWLLMVWIWNSIAMNWATKDSDIDLFIVTTKNTMWLNRIIITFIFSILWVRKTEKKHAKMFCLSFFATSDGLDFNDWKIENDIYLYYWILTFKPIINYNKTYEKFIFLNEKWTSLDKYKEKIEENKKYIYYSWNKNINNKFLWFFDNIIKKIFIKKTYKTYNKIWKPYWIIINNNLLKFHNNDIRKKIKKEILD